ncbi:hypothetical protein [Deinococcus multiflagellatus]|uniref:Lipopolysaccharide assembly protein A domain-containing protein n=1 Tax=Deinococcus multiflagellatus TaxID=1656887 RepID=A0ABW1ZL85_9DEIO|nr:hypothetical protein [Deinococcus multiflagellatus]MBZ9713156.1 hypothetical protein [Deinococcus multiflagellatus]
MRLVSFLQVLFLLGLLAYLALVTLENPGLVRLPLPLGGGEFTLSVGAGVAVFLLLGAAFMGLLLLPGLWRERLRRGHEARLRREAEERLTATLQARLRPAGSAEGPREEEG